MTTRYLFVQAPSDGSCPSGTTAMNVQPKNNPGGAVAACRTPCLDEQECAGYPGLSIKNNTPTMNGQTLNDQYYFVATGGDKSNQCAACENGGIPGSANGGCDHGLDGACCNNASPGNTGTSCDVDPDAKASNYVLQRVCYSGDKCQTPCDPTKDCKEQQCQYRLSQKCGGVTPEKGWGCDPNQGCVQNGGQYATQADCVASGCEGPSGNSWSCVDGSCQNVGAGNGDYSDSSCNNACGGSGGGSNAVVVILSVVAGIILLAIIGMFVYLYLTGRKKKGTVSLAFRRRR